MIPNTNKGVILAFYWPDLFPMASALGDIFSFRNTHLFCLISFTYMNRQALEEQGWIWNKNIVSY